MKTLTVGELIKELRKHPDHTPVKADVVPNTALANVESVGYLPKAEIVILNLKLK